MEKGVEIVRAGVSEMPVIANMLQLYLYEFSDGMQTDLEDDGRYRWDGLEDYWTQDDLHPFLVRIKGRLAGFALVQRYSVVSQTTSCWDIEDFFILAKYRGKGVGQCLSAYLFQTFIGAWEVRVLSDNYRAQRFWQHSISTHSAGPVRQVSFGLDQREFLVFQFETSGEPENCD